MRVVLLLFGIITINVTDAQFNKGSLTFQAAFPTADYWDNYNVIPTGLLFNFTHELKNQPAFCYGGEIGIMQVSGTDAQYTGVYDNEYNTFLVASWNHVVTLGAVFDVNLLPENTLFNVNVSITAGTNLFITTSSITRDIVWILLPDIPNTKYYYSDIHASFALRIGGGVDVEIPFGRQKKVSALIKASYLYGSHANYYGRPTIVDTQIILSPQSSGTSMILAEAGIRFYMFNTHNKNKGL